MRPFLSTVFGVLRPKRRWFQSSLRTLFLVTTGFAVWLGILTHRARQQERVVALVQELGVQVTYAHEIMSGVTVYGTPTYRMITSGSTKLPKPLPPLKRFIGEHYFITVGRIHLSGPEVTDSVLSQLRPLRRLRSLTLADTEITDRGLVHLERLTALEVLILDRTRITDAGLKHVAKLKNLEMLTLGGTKVSDGGLRHLRGLANLRVLGLGSRRPDGVTDGTNVTWIGEKELRRALPNLIITR